ncbi:MAG: GerMN domain-containing protein [Acidaminobacteraceae bacterium]
MSKFFLNIFFIIIMGLSLTLAPINIDMLDFENISFDFTKSKTGDQIPDDASQDIISVFETSIPTGTYLYNPGTIDITIKSIDDLSMYPNELKNNLTIDIFKFDSLVKSVALSSLNSDISISTDSDVNVLSMSIPIDRLTHNIKTGHYTIKVSSNSEKTSIFKTLEYSVTYIDDKKYIMATDDDMNKTIATLYYPDKDFLWSVPVTHEISSRRNSQIRSILNAILEGPKADSGLNDGTAGPSISSAYIKNGVLTLKTSSTNVKKYDEDSALASASLDTMINSLVSLDNVNELKFLVNNSSNGTYFNGSSIKDGFKILDKSKVYLGLQTTNDYIYLVPIAYGSVDDIKIEDMFETLKHASIANKSSEGLLQSVPQNVNLLNSSLEDDVLTLNLSKEFLNSYKSSEDYSLLMIDSLVYSYTSYDKIDSVRITVDGNIVDDFFGINISTPMRPKLYINPRFDQ